MLAATAKPLELLSYLAAVVALLLLWSQSRSDAARARATASLEYVRQFNSEPLSGHRTNLAKPWLRYRGALDQINSGPGLSDAEADRLTAHVVSQYDIENPGQPATLSILEIASFYDQIQICIDVDACDGGVARSYFQEEAAEFFETHSVIIRSLRKSISGRVGRGLERFVAEGTAQ